MCLAKQPYIMLHAKHNNTAPTRTAWQFFCNMTLLISIFYSNNTYAEQAKQFDDIQVHYNAFNSTVLTPKIAKHYDILRSRTYGVINIAVKRQAPPTQVAIPASITGTASNLVGQQFHLDFQEIREGESIYYLSHFRFTDAETLRFKLDIKPAGKQDNLSLGFRKTLYWQ